ncbi:tRNA (adenosine(37)-N6)-threonylcarbamoyltransferase complex dimerization subunit type 1 TsaB [Jannaschia sp. W003]|uniref:tRNA (adenosine(37)-N6)-threonylcarbamoyltransferase complex dimerization subunit type 1 TsaB n=1 Tax=Jannaschia sp. W003 TaxID=2867012 RepID=UPI0021A371B6|nr:tRNA (adenosine(37)-N6)-threonylcarbamoyltransferase complex dimerization subunit type 1 TsaB [Jannaschia sp. W003]UWQ21649.1 tRNA (adenosine(37)-N6)-threonylcarbamoyltransferase complex dimerization subunit type 1 TsaB [Jannaschia sp. W003]
MSDRLTLGFDTAAAHCAAALVSGDRVVAEGFEAMARGQAEALFPLLDGLLREAGAAWDDLHALGVGVGPGNFTGIRIAVAAARGLALGLRIPCEGVSAFEALAPDEDTPVAVAAPRGAMHVGWRGGQMLLEAGAPWPEGWPRRAAGAAVNGIEAVPARPLAQSIARIAAARAAPGRPRPAPLYGREADALPRSDPPPRIIPDA